MFKRINSVSERDLHTFPSGWTKLPAGREQWRQKLPKLPVFQTCRQEEHTHSQIYIHDTPTHSSKSKNADVLDSCWCTVTSWRLWAPISNIPTAAASAAEGDLLSIYRVGCLIQILGLKVSLKHLKKKRLRFLFSWASVKNKVKNGRLRAKKDNYGVKIVKYRIKQNGVYSFQTQTWSWGLSFPSLGTRPCFGFTL